MSATRSRFEMRCRFENDRVEPIRAIGQRSCLARRIEIPIAATTTHALRPASWWAVVTNAGSLPSAQRCLRQCLRDHDEHEHQTHDHEHDRKSVALSPRLILGRRVTWIIRFHDVTNDKPFSSARCEETCCSKRSTSMRSAVRRATRGARMENERQPSSWFALGSCQDRHSRGHADKFCDGDNEQRASVAIRDPASSEQRRCDAGVRRGVGICPMPITNVLLARPSSDGEQTDHDRG